MQTRKKSCEGICLKTNLFIEQEEINQLKAQAVFEPGLSYTDHFFSGSVI